MLTPRHQVIKCDSLQLLFDPIRHRASGCHDLNLPLTLELYPTPTDVEAIPNAHSIFPSIFDSLPPPVSCVYFRSMYSRRRGPSSSQHRPASTPTAIESDRPVLKETQAILEHHKGIISEDLDQMADIEPLDDAPLVNDVDDVLHAELDVDRGRKHRRGRARRRGRGCRGRERSRD